MTMKSKIPAGVRFDGEVLGDGDLVVAGRVQGEVRIGGALTVDAGGQVNGDVRARVVTVSGAVVGDVTASESVHVNAGARLVGDIEARRVKIAQGAKFRGNVRMPRVRAVEWEERALSAEAGVDAPAEESGDTLTPPAPAHEAEILPLMAQPPVARVETTPGMALAESVAPPSSESSAPDASDEVTKVVERHHAPKKAASADTAQALKADGGGGEAQAPRRVRNRDNDLRPRRTRRARRVAPAPVMPTVGRVSGRRRDVPTE